MVLLALLPLLKHFLLHAAGAPVPLSPGGVISWDRGVGVFWGEGTEQGPGRCCMSPSCVCSAPCLALGS